MIVQIEMKCSNVHVQGKRNLMSYFDSTERLYHVSLDSTVFGKRFVWFAITTLFDRTVFGKRLFGLRLLCCIWIVWFAITTLLVRTVFGKPWTGYCIWKKMVWFAITTLFDGTVFGKKIV
jgi:hypothetical protein